MHASQLLDFPIPAGALMMAKEDVEQPFGQVSWRSQAFNVGRRCIPYGRELLQERKQPLAILAEDFFLHYEHVAERTLVAVQYGIRILPVVRVILAKDLVHEAEIADSQVIVACIMLDQRMIPPHGFNIVDGRGNDIPADHLALDGFIIQAIPPCSGLVDEVVHDFTVVVGLVGYVAEIEVATVVTESVVIGIDVFPSPILRSELAIHGIE